MMFACFGCESVWNLDMVKPDLDPDDDGLLDAEDNCPANANTNQDDEDADGLGDACDPCPITSDATDTDEDGVGDLCDPNPATGGQVLALFEGFEHGVPDGFLSNHTWTAGDGEVSIAGPIGDRPSLYVEAKSAHETITTAMSMKAAFGTSYRIAGIKDNAALGANAASTVCAVLITANTDGGFPNSRMIDLFHLPSTNDVIKRALFAWPSDEEVVLAMTRTDTDYSCTASHAGGTQTVSGPHPLELPMPYAGLHVEDAEVHYKWLMIVTSP
jgi:hypothetical protein